MAASTDHCGGIICMLMAVVVDTRRMKIAQTVSLLLM